MECLGFKPWTSNWQAQKNPLSYGGLPPPTMLLAQVHIFGFLRFHLILPKPVSTGVSCLTPYAKLIAIVPSMEVSRKEMNTWIGPTVKQLWNYVMYVLHKFLGFNLNTTAYCLCRSSLHFLLLKTPYDDRLMEQFSRYEATNFWI